MFRQSQSHVSVARINPIQVMHLLAIGYRAGNEAMQRRWIEHELRRDGADDRGQDPEKQSERSPVDPGSDAECAERETDGAGNQQDQN
jgi:hypothetical protein